MTTYLNKQIIVAGRHCLTRAHRLAHQDPAQAERSITVGDWHAMTVAKAADRLFRSSIRVPASSVDGLAAVDHTRALLADPRVGTIKHAVFESQGVTVRMGYIARCEGGFSMYAVSTGMRFGSEDYFRMAVDAYVAEQAGLPLEAIYVVYPDPDNRSGNSDPAHGLTQSEITLEVKACYQEVVDAIAISHGVVMGKEPQTVCTGHCQKPVPCAFLGQCQAQGPAMPLTWLPNGHHLVARSHGVGVLDMRELPEELVKSKSHRRVIDATIDNRVDLVPGFKAAWEALPFQRYFLDIESAQSPFSLYEGVKPYQQIPFQWSLHHQDHTGTIRHDQFLDLSGSDPRRAFARQLIDVCGQDGPVVVYNASFERRILNELATEYPEMASALLAIIDRLFDLLPLVKKHYYHPMMKGSWSLKQVLKALVPELSYEALSLRNGEEAQLAYLQAIAPETSTEKKRQIAHDLGAYCHLDTFAMIAIPQALIALEEGNI